MGLASKRALVLALRQRPLLPQIAGFRSAAQNPGELGGKDEGLWYRVPPETVENLQMLEKYEMLDPHLKDQVQTFGGLELMARRHFLDILNVLDKTDLRLPALRFVLHGLPGTGKATTLSQLAQWGIAQGWTIAYFPNCIRTVRPKKGVGLSSWREGRVDTPIESSDWLARFKLHNTHSYNTTLAQLKTSREYTWSRRESTPAGAPLMEVVEQGIATPARADDCAGVLMKELRAAASAGQHRLLVLAARANALFVNSRVKREDGSWAPASALSMAQTIRKSLGNDWSGGAVAVTTDPEEFKDRMHWYDAHRLLMERPPNTPVQILMAEGFETLHPFIPVHIPNYSPAEAESLFAFYQDHNWIQETLHPFIPVHIPNYSPAEAESLFAFYQDHNWIQVAEAKENPGKTELFHIAGFNPQKLERLVAAL